MEHSRGPRRADRSRQVSDVIRHELRAHHEQDALPDELALGRQLAATRNAVREALDLLRSQGLVERRRGEGTFVTAPRARHSIDRLLGLSESLRTTGTVTNDVLEAGTVAGQLTVCAALHQSAAEPLLRVERLRRVNGEPFSLDTSYFPGALAAPLLSANLASTDLITLLHSELHLNLGHAEVSIEAVAAEGALAEVLGLRPGAPVLAVDRVLKLADGLPLAVEFLRMRADRLTLTAVSELAP